MIRLYLIIFLVSALVSQIPIDYSLDRLVSLGNLEDKRDLIEGVLSQSTVDMQLVNNNSIVVGTSKGLHFIDDSGYYYYEDGNLPVGGNPAIITYPIDNLMVVSGVQTIDYNGESVASGTGLAFSIDNGDTWEYIDQPIDIPPDCEDLGCEDPLNPEECDCSPTSSGCSWNVPLQICSYTNGSNIFEWGGQSLSSLMVQTTAKNVTYDISVDLELEHIYAASWAGMLRRFKYTDTNPFWELVPLPTDNLSTVSCGEYPDNYIYNPIDPIISGNLNSGGNHNHKAFSVYSEFYNNTNYIWAGTADGVNRGVVDESGCIDWEHYNTSNGLAGDWIIDIVPQDIGTEIPRIWLISWNRDGGPSPHGLTYSDDNGETWSIVNQFINEQAIVYNLYFNEDQLYASTDKGLYLSNLIDLESWTKILFPIDILESLENDDKVYTSISNESNFFIGTPNGIVKINESNFGDDNAWQTKIGFDPTIMDRGELQIYPNPYVIDENELKVKFKFNSPINGILDIYNFSMDRVKSEECAIDNNGDLLCKWNGRNHNNIKVANGVYFCKLTSGKNESWGKLMVINANKGDY